MTTFYELSGDDKRLPYAAEYLQNYGLERVDDMNKADFAVAGVNPVGISECSAKIIYAGNVKGNNVIDYTKDEEIASKVSEKAKLYESDEEIKADL